MIICKLIVVVLLMVVLPNNKNTWYTYTYLLTYYMEQSPS